MRDRSSLPYARNNPADAMIARLKMMAYEEDLLRVSKLNSRKQRRVEKRENREGLTDEMTKYRFGNFSYFKKSSFSNN